MRYLSCFGLMLMLFPSSRAAEKPNVLFIAVDDLRPEFGAYGKSYVKSPNMDKLAARGITFNRAYCQQAVCSPTRSSLLTGCRPDTTKVYDLVTHFRKAIPDVVTLPQHFKQNGYYVQGMGKIYHGGFDDEPSWSTPWTSPKNVQQYGSKEAQAIAKEVREKSIKDGKTPKQAARGPAFEGADVPDNTFHDGALADMAVDALRMLKEKKEPFFLAVGFIKPHLPFVAPKKYWDLYDPAKIELAKNSYRPKGAPEYAVLEGGEMRNYHGIPKGHIPDDLARKLKHGYYASISYMDAQFGKVLDELDKLGLKDNTIIVLWGDHGWKLGEHDAWCKHTNVENDTNVTLLMSAPGLKTAGKKSDSIVEFVDVYPTLAELCGLPLPKHLEGVSFAPLLSKPEMVWKLAAFSQYPRTVNGKQLMGYSMRTDRYRYTRWVERDDHKKSIATELYDHTKDPGENNNLAFVPKPKDNLLDPELTDLTTLNLRELLPQLDSMPVGEWRWAFPTLGEVSSILSKSDQWQLYSLDAYPRRGEAVFSFFFGSNYLHGWLVLGKTIVKDSLIRKTLVDELEHGLRQHIHKQTQNREDGRLVLGGCFQPRHGIRVMHEGKPVDILLCFECGYIETHKDGNSNRVWTTTDAAQEAFDAVFKKAEIPLSPRLNK